MSWFTPSYNIVSNVYAVYNGYDVFHFIKQPSACWTLFIMCSGRVFLPQIAHGNVAVFVFVIIQCLRLVVGFKPYTGIY